MDSRQILFALLRMQVCGAECREYLTKLPSQQILEDVYSLALKHDLAHIVGQALSDLGCLGTDEISQKLKKQAMLAVYRYTKMEHELQSICNALEKAGISYMPLKGAVIRKYYPQDWMRTSCDIDVMVKETELDAAASVLVDELGYRRGGKNDHDVSMHSANGVHLELHYSALAREQFGKAQAVLENMWKMASPDETGGFCYYLADEMLYYFHIAHMMKHFDNGGCGIRAFLDLWILNHKVQHDRKKRESLLAEGGLLTFARAAERLSEVWFSGAQTDSAVVLLERFVLDGGAYGSLKNSVAVKQVQKGSMLKYALSKVWLPYHMIKYYYPVLQKHKWLMPVYQVHRWLRIIFCSGLKRSIQTLETNARLEEKERAEAQRLLEELGL